MKELRKEQDLDGDRPVDEMELELERLRAMLLQSAKLAELGTRIATLVHEMNQPLVAIKAFAQMILADSDDEVAVRRASMIEKQAEVLASLVGRIRTHSRQSTNEDTCDLSRVADTSLELLDHVFRRGKVDLEVLVGPGPIVVPLDKVQLQQVLVNLLTNAVDAVEDSSCRRVRLSTGIFDGEAFVEVADTGSGIPEEIAQKVLDPFFTTKDPERGTGLGLSVCTEIVKSCGGTLSIESSPTAVTARDEDCDAKTSSLSSKDGAKGEGTVGKGESASADIRREFKTRVKVILPLVAERSEELSAEGGME